MLLNVFIFNGPLCTVFCMPGGFLSTLQMSSYLMNNNLYMSK